MGNYEVDVGDMQECCKLKGERGGIPQTGWLHRSVWKIS